MCLRVTNLLSLACSLGLVLAGDSARAGTRTWDFTTDPTLDTSTNALTIGGNNATIWQATTGNPGGFLALTYAETSQSAAVIFPDIDQGKIVTGFEFDCDLRIGNPSTAGPADGFSINFARISDPMIINTPPDVTNAGVSGQPEDGTGTGIAIGFDTWSGNTLADGTADLVGIIVSVDKTVVLKQPMPTISGAADDATSMQTGPRDGAYWDGGGAAEDPAAWAGLQWRHLSVVLDTTAKLSVTYKGKVLLDKFQTAYFPSAGRIVLMGRTGSSDENTHFDNITLTTTATSDNQPPSAIANLKVAEVGAGHVTLTWDPSTDLPDATARVAYNIQRGGTNLVLSLTTNRFVDFGVKPNTKYDYQVQAVDLAGNTSAFSPISATTVAEVPSVGVVKGEIYDNISGTTVDLLLADPTYPNTPSRVTYINSLFFGTASGNAGFANSFGDNYGARITGTITPTASGQYNFFIRSDDSSQFYLNTSSATLPVPGTDTPLIEETSCCHAFLEPTDTTEPSVTTQTPVSLTAGKSYGFVILLKEGGGGDGVGVAWRLASDTSPAATLPAISGAVLTGTQDAVGASVTFTTSPKDTTVIENEKVVFTAAATAVSAFGTSVGYQWYKNGTAIPGAFGATYTIPVVALSDSGSKFKVMAIGIGAQTTSPEVTLTVTADKKAPTITSVNGDETGTILTVGFSEPVTSPSATTAANYALNNGGTVSAATLSADRFSVQLTTPKLTETTVYTLTVNNVKDNAGNSVAADSKFLFQSWGLVAGRAKMEQWNNIANTDVASLLSDASYAGPPSVTRYLPGLQAGNPNGNGGWNDSFGDNYGARIKAYIIPTETAKYDFFIRSDDSSRLYVSANDTFPDPATATVTAEETGCCKTFLEPGNATEASVTTAAPLSLTAGTKYAVLVFLKEGTGGDGVAVGWRKVGATNAAADLPSIMANAYWYGPPVATNVLATGDAIVASSTNFPAAEIAANVLDGNSATKYLNFDKLNAGFTVTPKLGATVITGIQLTTANDHPQRDPATFLIEGSWDGTTFTTIASGAVTHSDTRLSKLPAITFANTAPYTIYRVTFPTVYDATDNSMQVADVALLGNVYGGVVAAPATGSKITFAKTASNLVITYTGTLQSADTITGTFTDVAGATSPYSATTSAGTKFFRAKQ